MSDNIEKDIEEEMDRHFSMGLDQGERCSSLAATSGSANIRQFAKDLREHLADMHKDGKTVEQMLNSIEECASEFINESIFE